MWYLICDSSYIQWISDCAGTKHRYGELMHARSRDEKQLEARTCGRCCLSQWLHLCDFSPLCLFKLVLKTSVKEDAKPHYACAISWWETVSGLAQAEGDALSPSRHLPHRTNVLGLRGVLIFWINHGDRGHLGSYGWTGSPHPLPDVHSHLPDVYSHPVLPRWYRNRGGRVGWWFHYIAVSPRWSLLPDALISRYQLINCEINQLIRTLLRSFRIAHLCIEWTKVDLCSFSEEPNPNISRSV